MFFPQTYRLNKKKECKQFFNEIANGYAERVNKTGPEWVLKTDQHRGEGIHLLFGRDADNITTVYENGSKCGNITDKHVA
jgi:tubulin polyglutamylase TTLL1